MARNVPLTDDDKALIATEYAELRAEGMSARDAWAASMGFQSGRDMKAIILHRQFGEVARHIVSVDMLRNIAKV